MVLVTCLLACQTWGHEQAVVDLSQLELSPVKAIQTPTKEPVFLRELYTLKRLEDFRVARFMGFNAVIERGEEIIEPARQTGFWVTEANWYTAEGYGKAKDEALRYARESNVLAINLCDEPDLRSHVSPPDAMQKAAALVWQHAPMAKTSITLAGTGRARELWPEYVKAADIIRVDPYPLVSRKPLSHVKDLIEAAQHAGEQMKPVLCILQAWTFPNGPFPNGDQIRQMAWQALIAGAAGLSYFDWADAEWTKHPTFWRAIIGVNSLIHYDLSPFLLTGLRTPAIESHGVYAALWMHPEAGWRVLVTRLDDAPAPQQVTVRLPRQCFNEMGYGIRRVETDVDAYRHVPAGATTPELQIELGPLSTLILGPSRGQAKTPWFWNDALPRPLPNASVVYTADLAGRPWARVGRRAHREQTMRPYTPYLSNAAESHTFAAAGLSCRLEGDTLLPAPFARVAKTARVFAGGRFQQRLHVHRGRAKDLTFRIASWHDNDDEHGPDVVADWVTVQEQKGRWPSRQTTYDISLKLPTTRAWSTVRDHLLEFQLVYQFGGRLNHSTRVLRYRFEPAFDFDWRWDGPASGTLTANPRFAEAQLPCAVDALELRCQSGKVANRIQAGTTPWRWRIELEPQNNGQGRHELSASLHGGGEILARHVATTFCQAENSILSPKTPRSYEVARLSNVDLANASFETLWARRTEAKAMRFFLAFGKHEFAADRQSSWLAYTDDHVFFFAEGRSPEILRMDTKEKDSRFMGDDVFGLLIGGAEAGSLYRVQVNPAATSHHAKLLPAWDLSWDPDLQIWPKVDTATRTWRVVLALPWSSLGWENDTPEVLRFNVVSTRSIAPRQYATWHFMTMPFKPEESLAEGQLMSAAGKD